MQYRTKTESQALQLKKLRRDYDYVWQSFGKTIPRTNAKLKKFSEQLIAILDDRLNKGQIFRSNSIITKLPTNLSHIVDDPNTSGVRKVAKTKKVKDKKNANKKTAWKKSGA